MTTSDAETDVKLNIIIIIITCTAYWCWIMVLYDVLLKPNQHIKQ